MSLALYTPKTTSARDAVRAREALLGVRVRAVRRYYTLAGGVPVQEAQELASVGYRVIMSFAVDSYAAVAAGQKDAQIDAVGRALASLDEPCYVTLQHEPDLPDNRGKGTPADFARALKRFVDRAGALSPTDSYGMILCGWEGENLTAWQPAVDAAMLDFVGFDRYCYPDGTWSGWQWPERIYETTLQHGNGLGFPDVDVLLTELGCAEDPADPWRKGEWLLRWAAIQPRLEVAAYFDIDKEETWSLTSSPYTLSAAQSVRLGRTSS